MNFNLIGAVTADMTNFTDTGLPPGQTYYYQVIASNADASRINSLTVADNTIACDKKSGELWVSFVRTDGPSFEPRVDMTIVIPDIGIWSWKGLSGKFEVAAKTADSK